MTRADVIIAGGGVIGLMTGWMLARARLAVIVVDAGMPAATDAAAGMLAPSFERALRKSGAALAGFSAQSLRRWPDVAALLKERSGVDCDFQRGVLSVAFSEQEAAVFDENEEGGALLTRDEIVALEPAIATTVVGGRHATEDGQIDPRRLRLALENAFANDGGRILRGRSVAEIRARERATPAVALRDGEILHADRVVVATGARLPSSGDARAPLLPPGAIFPVKGEALALKRVIGAPSRVVRTARAYLCPKADGRVVVGATEVDRDWSLNTDAARVEALKAGAEFAFPALKDATEIERWAGLRPATRDGAPIIGAAPESPGVILALGHYRNGILLAPATAEAIVRLIVERVADPAIAAFSPARFAPLGVS